MKIIVSACLLGRNCKYSGGNNFNERAVEFCRGQEVIEVCPEVLAGLGIPRTPIEIVDGVLTDKNGRSVDVPLRGAIAALLEELPEADCAVLQSRSPTCGVNQIYDGTFSGKLIPGSGVFAQALRERKIRLIDAEDLA